MGSLEPVFLLQAASNLAALVFFAFTTCARTGMSAFAQHRRSGTRRIASLALAALLVFFDPLIAHYNLSILPDSIALSASLCFCACLTLLAPERPRCSLLALSGLALFAFVAAGLRPEKWMVICTTVFACVGVWSWRARRGGPPLPWTRAIAIAGAVLVGAVGSQLIQLGLTNAPHRWPLALTVVEQRVVFPNLAAVHDALPGHLREAVPRHLAEKHDVSLVDARSVIRRLPGGDAFRREFVSAAALEVVRARSHWLAFDLARDTFENLFPTFSYPVRLFASSAVGRDLTEGTRFRLAQSHPLLTAIYERIAWLFLCAALVWVAVVLFRDGGRRGAGASSSWFPAVLFAAINAVAFSVAADFTVVRYAIFAHAATLLALYAFATGTWRADGPRS